MELEEEDAKICRLCGQCENIYIDIFGEEGIKRFLGLKIHTKINILIQPNDGLPQAICLRCLGTLEFLCDFHEQCHFTQKALSIAYQEDPTGSTFQKEVDPESDKENAQPAQTVIDTRRNKTKSPTESPKVTKNSSLTNNGHNTLSSYNKSSSDTKKDEALASNSSVQINQSSSSESTAVSSPAAVPIATTSSSTSTTSSTNGISPTIKENNQRSSNRISENNNRGEKSQEKQSNAVRNSKRQLCDDDNESPTKESAKKKRTSDKGQTTLEMFITRSPTELKKVSPKSSSKSQNDKRDTTPNGMTNLVERRRSSRKNLQEKEQKPDKEKKGKRKSSEGEENSISSSNINSSSSGSSTSNSGSNNNNNNDNDDNIVIKTSTPRRSINKNKGRNHSVNGSPIVVENHKSRLSGEKSRGKAVSVIVKPNKTVSRSSSMKNNNECPWTNKDKTSNEPDKPKTQKAILPNASPPPGDEAETTKESANLADQPRSTVIISSQSNAETDNDKVEYANLQNPFVEKNEKLEEDGEDNELLNAEVENLSLRCRMEQRIRARTISRSSSQEEKYRNKDGTFGRVSELMSDEQKQAVETYYRVDMSVVDVEKVLENLCVLGIKKFRCNICNTIYPRMDKCQVHVWGHLNMRPYQCKACNFATVTVSNVRCHIRKSHLKIKPFACHLCEKKYVTAVLLDEHLNTHTGARPFKCTVCNFASSSRQVLTYHMTTHKPVKDISCDVCGSKFYSKGRMRAHMIIHNKNTAFMCKLCSTYLSSAEALETHRKNIHSRDYVCNVCNKRYRSRKALHNHQNVHSAAKYKCYLCPNVYKSSHILKEHLLKHEGIRKYKCNVCGKSFAQQSHLAAHMAVHSEVRYHCPGCQKAFNRHDNMKIHTRRCDLFCANPELMNQLAKRESSRSTNKVSKSTASRNKKTVDNNNIPDDEDSTIPDPYSTEKPTDQIAVENSSIKDGDRNENNSNNLNETSMLYLEESFDTEDDPLETDDDILTIDRSDAFNRSNLEVVENILGPEHY